MLRVPRKSRGAHGRLFCPIARASLPRLQDGHPPRLLGPVLQSRLTLKGSASSVWKKAISLTIARTSSAVAVATSRSTRRKTIPRLPTLVLRLLAST